MFSNFPPKQRTRRDQCTCTCCVTRCDRGKPATIALTGRV
ncbi:hypothetical protein ANCDUO_21706 [Ancylostoma duodenale]|uniref:Uncharacterized protein n=1 Tax=Ancylostoma duodenale TaxID=51022 RepID=A0A0C2CEE9_9BILA|nr:hypothetical protein ANCDUO_21706 [Ancylostoma duodenale]